MFDIWLDELDMVATDSKEGNIMSVIVYLVIVACVIGFTLECS